MKSLHMCVYSAMFKLTRLRPLVDFWVMMEHQVSYSSSSKNRCKMPSRGTARSFVLPVLVVQGAANTQQLGQNQPPVIGITRNVREAHGATPMLLAYCVGHACFWYTCSCRQDTSSIHRLPSTAAGNLCHLRVQEYFQYYSNRLYRRELYLSILTQHYRRKR